ncbi:hypothetical protein M422DRAFT_65481 [Sphaerobolus stellatus SS14]|nr:hypothetical protein M422DRAFT_65481 [Sphaerobolus stellatus SS14]
MASSQFQSSCIWESRVFHREPVWPRDPKIAALISLSRQHLRVSDTTDIHVDFFSQGAFNKLYTVTSSSLTRDYICVSLFQFNHASKPPVIAHATTSENELGFEWILMERLPGEKDKAIELASPSGILTCTPVDWEGKENITRAVLQYMQELWNIPFKSIGSLYLRSDMERLHISTIETNDPEFVLGPLVSLRLFYGGLRSRVNRNLGPYPSERDYILAWAEVQLQEVDLAQTLNPGDPQYDEDLVDDAPKIKAAIEALCRVGDVLFSPQTDDGGYVLHHNDLSLANILVDPNTFNITGIVDWECIGTAPRWEDAYPDFIHGPEVETDPQPWEEGDTDLARAELWESWEKAKLRKIFDSPISEEEEIKTQFVMHLTEVDTWHGRAEKWARAIAIRLQPLKGSNRLRVKLPSPAII